MRKRSLSLIVAVLALAVLSTAVWAGSQAEKGGAAAAAPTVKVQWRDGDKDPRGFSFTSMTQQITLPISKTKEKLTIMFPHYGLGSEKANFDDYRNFKLIEQKTGVDVTWQAVARQQYYPLMQTILASGEDMPDVMDIRGGSMDFLMGLADAKIILPLDELIFQYAPDIRVVYDIWPYLRKLLTFPDGKHYLLPKVMDNLGWTIPPTWKKEWMDKLNLQKPKNFADWENAFRAIKNGDPNGNGKMDECGWSSYDGNLLPYYAGMYWFGWGMNWDYSVVDGKLQYKWYSQNMKDCVAWLNKCYKEQWFQPVAIDDPANWGKVTDKWPTIQGAGGWLTTYKDPSATPDFYKQNVILDPWLDYYGKNYGKVSGFPGFWAGATTGNYGWVITKAAKDPVLAIKFMDWLYGTPEGTILLQYGEEGVDYAWKGTPMQDASLYAFQADTDKTEKGKADPIYYMDEMTWVVPTSWNSKYNMKTNTMFDQIWNQWKNHADPGLAIPFFNAQEKILNGLSSIPGDYITPMIRKFIIGEEPLANWDTFVAQLKKYGADSRLKAYESAYARMLKM